MIKINPDLTEHRDLVAPYYFAWYRTDDVVNFLRTQGYSAFTDDIRLIYLRLQRAGVPRYDKAIILNMALDELKKLHAYNSSWISFDKK